MKVGASSASESSRPLPCLPSLSLRGTYQCIPNSTYVHVRGQVLARRFLMKPSKRMLHARLPFKLPQILPIVVLRLVTDLSLGFEVQPCSVPNAEHL